MGNIELLKADYYSVLKDKKEKCEAEIKKLKNLEKNDEANLVKIRLNVIDIFNTLFNTSYKKVCGFGALSSEDEYKKLLEIYLEFFEKIPAPWKEKYDKAKSRELVIDYVIEEIKIKTADELKQVFLKVSNNESTIN